MAELDPSKMSPEMQKQFKLFLELTTNADKASKDVVGFQKHINDLEKSFHKLSNNASKVLQPFQALANMAGVTLTLRSFVNITTSLNNEMAKAAISFNKYGVGVAKLESRIETLSKGAKIARTDILAFTRSFEKDFNIVSLSNVENLFKNITKIVGSNIEAINEMKNSVSGLANAFPDIENSLININDQNRKQVESTVRLLALTGQLSTQQYKSLQEYISGTTKLSSEDRKRIDTLQAQQKAIESIKQQFTDIAIKVGQTLLPVIQGIVDASQKWSWYIDKIVIGLTAAASLASIAATTSFFSGLFGIGKQGIGGLGKVGGFLGSAGSSIGGKFISRNAGGIDYKSTAGNVLKGGGRLLRSPLGIAAAGTGFGMVSDYFSERNGGYNTRTGTALGILGNVGQYAGYGAIFGLPGAAVGGAIGAGVGAYEATFGYKKDKVEEAKNIDNRIKIYDELIKKQKEIQELQKEENALYKMNSTQLNESYGKAKQELEEFNKKNKELIEGLQIRLESQKALAESTGNEEDKKAFLKTQEKLNPLLDQQVKIESKLAAIDMAKNARSNILRANLQAQNQLFSTQLSLVQSLAQYQGLFGGPTASGYASGASNIAELQQQGIARVNSARMVLETAKADYEEIMKKKSEGELISDSDLSASRAKAMSAMKEFQNTTRQAIIDSVRAVGEVLKIIEPQVARTLNIRRRAETELIKLSAGGNIEAAGGMVSIVIDTYKKEIELNRQNNKYLQERIDKEKEAFENAKIGSVEREMAYANLIEYQDLLNKGLEAEVRLQNEAREAAISKISEQFKGQKDYLDSQIALQRSQMELVQSIGVGFAKSATMQLDYAKGIMGQVGLIEQELEKLIDLRKDAMDPAEQMRLDTEINRKLGERADKTREAAEALKSLRDGYVSAVQAQVIGEGKISKIVVDQSKNLGTSLMRFGMLQSFTSGGLGGGGGIREFSRMTPTGFTAPSDKTVDEQMYKTYLGGIYSGGDPAREIKKRVYGVAAGETAAIGGINPAAGAAAIQQRVGQSIEKQSSTQTSILEVLVKIASKLEGGNVPSSSYYNRFNNG